MHFLLNIANIFSTAMIQKENETELEGYRFHLEKLLEERTKALTVNEEERRLLWIGIENSTDGFLITDLSGKIKYVNTAYTKISQYSKEEMIGNHPRMFSSDRMSKEFYQTMNQTIYSGIPWKGKLFNKKKDDSLFEEEMAISSIFDMEGKITNFVAIKRDVSMITKMEQGLRLSEKLQAIGTLAGGIAHDFNNILQIIQVYSDILSHELQNQPDQAKKLTQINNSIIRGKDLILKILTFSRQKEDVTTDQNIKMVIEDALSFIKPMIPSTIQLQSSLTDCGILSCNSVNIQQILMNLVNNSVQASVGKAVIRTELSSTNDPMINGKKMKGHWIHLMVADNGKGMDTQTQSRIFEPFFTTKELGQGTGLGLSTVLGIVQAHLGQIDVESAPGKGTTIHIYFPGKRE
ncbi:MAG: ATP-binding protein, partial [Bacteroidota bacterium]